MPLLKGASRPESTVKSTMTMTTAQFKDKLETLDNSDLSLTPIWLRSSGRPCSSSATAPTLPTRPFATSLTLTTVLPRTPRDHARGDASRSPRPYHRRSQRRTRRTHYPDRPARAVERASTRLSA